MKTIASFSFKGGVGKTTTAVNLAFAAAAAGRQTLLIDLDAQGAASFYFRVRPSRGLSSSRFFTSRKRLFRAIKATDYEGLDLLAAHRSFRNLDIVLHHFKKPHRRIARVVKQFAAEYDLVVLDCPPTASLLSESVCQAADLVLVPVIPTTLCYRTYTQLIEMYAQKGWKIGRLRPFFSMVQADNKHHAELVHSMRSEFPNLLKAIIPYSCEIEQMGVRREPVFCYAEDQNPGSAYEELREEAFRLLAA